MTDQIISSEGYEKLKKEIEFLSYTKRQEIAERIERAKDMGDLNENAEYTEAKEAQAFNEGRIVELTQLMKNLTVVQNGPTKHSISMGSTIQVKVNSQKKEYIIVSFNEADPLTGRISNESPLGRAFIGKKKGDIVMVNTPKGDVTYEILEIK